MPKTTNPAKIAAENRRKADEIASLKAKIEDGAAQNQELRDKTNQLGHYLGQVLGRQNQADAADAEAVRVMSAPDDPEERRKWEQQQHLDRFEAAMDKRLDRIEATIAAGSGQAAAGQMAAHTETYRKANPTFDAARAHVKRNLSAVAPEGNVEKQLSVTSPEKIMEIAVNQGFQPATESPTPAAAGNGRPSPTTHPAVTEHELPPAGLASGRSPTPSEPGKDYADMGQEEWDEHFDKMAKEHGLTHIQMASKMMTDDGHVKEVDGSLGDLQIDSMESEQP